jgi:hypothetical protein
MQSLVADLGVALTKFAACAALGCAHYGLPWVVSGMMLQSQTLHHPTGTPRVPPGNNPVVPWPGTSAAQLDRTRHGRYFSKIISLTYCELTHYCGIEQTTSRSLLLKPINVKSNLFVWRC